jgi:hypothetical protein
MRFANRRHGVATKLLREEDRRVSAASGCRPLIKGFFGVALVVGAVMSSAFGAEN